MAIRCNPHAYNPRDVALLGFVNCCYHYLLYGQKVLVHILTNLLQMVVKCNALMLLAFFCLIRTKFSRT